MRRSIVVLVIILSGMLLAASIANADNSQLELYYNDCITKKIANCERIASAKNHKSPCMVRLVVMRSAQAKFYKKHREEIVKEMVARNIGKEPHKIDYFLITKFQESS